MDKNTKLLLAGATALILSGYGIYKYAKSTGILTPRAQGQNSGLARQPTIHEEVKELEIVAKPADAAT